MEYKAYSFDLDDNILKFPTKVYLTNQKGKEVEFSTYEFEKNRNNLDKLNLRITENSFRDFKNDEILLKDLKHAKKSGSFRNFKKCILKHTSLFAIITARGHSEKGLKKAIKQIILDNFTQNELEEFKIKYIEKYKKNIKISLDEALEDYLDKCKFYPTDNIKIKEKYGIENTSELKLLCFQEFRRYIYDFVKTNFGEDINVKIGFSDDSIIHLRKMMDEILEKENLFFYQTKNDKKERI